MLWSWHRASRTRGDRRPGGMAITLNLSERPDRRAVLHRGRRGTVTLERAVELGLVSEEGYLTPLGYQYWRRTG